MAKKGKKTVKASSAKPTKPSTQSGSTTNMAAASDTKAEAPAAAAGPAQASPNIGVRLVPTGDSDLPRFSNFARVQVSPSGVLVDFGFLEPAGLTALARTARAGGKMPESVNGRLAGRFALTPDTLVGLHQQLGQAIAGLRAGSKKA